MNFIKFFLYLFMLLHGAISASPVKIPPERTIFGEKGIRENLIKLHNMISKLGSDPQNDPRNRFFAQQSLSDLNFQIKYAYFENSTPLRNFLINAQPMKFALSNINNIETSKADLEKDVDKIKKQIQKISREELLQEITAFLSKPDLAIKFRDILVKLRFALSKKGLTDTNFIQLNQIFQKLSHIFYFPPFLPIEQSQKITNQLLDDLEKKDIADLSKSSPSLFAP